MNTESTQTQKIILVDDERPVRESTAQTLLLAGFQVDSYASAKAAMKEITTKFSGVIITDIRMPGMDGLQFMREILKIDRDLPVILISGHADVTMAVSAMREGGYDLLEKPFSAPDLKDTVKRALEKRSLTLENRALRALKEELESQNRIGPRIIGKTSSIIKLRKMVTKIANVDADVLISGETGTGKELVARSLHEQSHRRDHNFVAINCAAIPEALLDSELFGHEAGAFTGAKGKRIGKFEHADGGTLFLDEIEGMPLSIQAPLLRVLQERQIERLGSNKLIPLNLRIVAATKIDLMEAVELEEFRQDLYYRLNVVTLEIPPLRHRREDIPLLFEHFVLVAAARCETEVPPLNSQAIHTLMQHDWPGNIRELRNIAERYVLLGETYEFDLQQLMKSSNRLEGISLSEQVSCFERTLIEQALNQFKGNIKNVMDALDIPRKTLSDKMKKYALERQQYK